jgi:transposase, IS5 family
MGVVQSERSKKRSEGRRQSVYVPCPLHPTLALERSHPLVQLTERLDWTEMEAIAQGVRWSKLKSRAGRPPHLRALLGAVVLMATRRVTYREAEDQLRYYAPARHLCGLTETDWSPDHTTIHDFTELMGEEGLRLLNQQTVKLAVEGGLADPQVLVADTTAQEAAIPWPNEMGLMAAFMTAVAAASKKAGGLLRELPGTASETFKAAKEKVREYRLFAKSKEAKDKMMEEMSALVETVHDQLGSALSKAATATMRRVGYSKVAKSKLSKLHETMEKLLPQIRYWLRTGRVARGKVISLHIPELYSIVRGKVGKAVEFGLKWGIARLRGGFVLATVASKSEMEDTRFVLRAVDDHVALFGEPPRAYAYDRGGYSEKNVAALQAMGVRQVGLAPKGNAPWPVEDKQKEKLVKERALVEASIGSVKSAKYGFNRPGARSIEMMGACGQRAVLGFNLNKLVRGSSESAKDPRSG